MDHLNKLDDEIEALEKTIFGTQSEESTKEEQPTEEVIAAKEQVKPEVLNEEEETYKKRFINFKRSADQTIFGLRKELAETNKTIADLKTKLDELQSVKNKRPKLSEKFSEEDRKLFGEETLGVFDNYLDEQLSELEEKKKELAKQNRERELLRASEHEERAKIDFINTLSDLVPDYEEIDSDPRFIKWLEEVDPSTGSVRFDTFKYFQSRGNAISVATYFKNYKKERDKGKEELRQHITPVGSKAQPSNSSQTRSETWYETEFKKNPKAFIDRFYDEYTRGKYRGKEALKEAKAIERMIDNAVLGGPSR